MNTLNWLTQRTERKKDKAALHQFIQQLYWGENLLVPQAIRQLEQNVVELTQDGQHLANGLLITANGYILTAEHCIQRSNRLYAQNNQAFLIEKVCAADSRNEIALVKANISAESTTLEYRFYNSTLLKRLERKPVALLTRINGKIVRKYGLMEHASVNTTTSNNGKNCNYDDQILLSLDSAPGDSGGVVASDDGRIIGFHSGYNGQQHKGVEVKLFKALELVSAYLRTL